MAEKDKHRLLYKVEAIIENPVFKILIGGTIFAIAIFVLHKLAGEVSWQAVKTDMATLSNRALVLSAAFTALSFIALSLYDVLAVQSVAPGKIPWRTAAFAGASGYAVSNLLGFSWLTGSTVRAKIYSNLKMDVSALGGLIATIWVSFWLGIFLLMGLLLSFHPQGINSALGLGSSLETIIGITILVGIGGFFFWLAGSERCFSLFGFRFKLPNAKLAIGQSITAIFDVTGAALALYFLMPGDISQNIAYFFVVYVAAIGLGILSHSPGGLGVFEATLIGGLGAGGRSDVLASLVLYRVIYYLLPFSIFATIAGFLWRKDVGASGKHIASLSNAVVKPIVPIIAAGLALLSGIILIISGSLPGETSRFRYLQDLFPLPLIETSHLVASLIGVLLIALARGLYRKHRNAWVASVALMVIGGIASLSKGFDWEECLVLSFALLILVLFRSAFYRASVNPLFHLSRRWVFVSLIAIAASLWVGLFAYSHVPYNSQMWWDFAWNGDAPRYLRASLVVAVVFIGISLNSLFNSRGERLLPEPIPQPVRDLVQQSADTEGFINLTGDKRFLLSDNGKAFIAYGDGGSTLISKGDPIGDEKSCEEAIWKLREVADRLGKKAAYYSVSKKFLPTYLDLGCSILKIGEVARVDLVNFNLEGSSKKDFRQARNKAAREGYVFEIIPIAELEAVFPRLKEISDSWLASKHGQEKEFSVGAFDEEYLSNFNHAVLRNQQNGRIMAFANLFEGAGKYELSLDLMRYDPDGPSFVMDALFTELMVWGSGEGYKWFSLGAAPFSGFEDHPTSTVWNMIGQMVFEHGEHFYNFEGLRSFKEKFEPVWEPNYLAVQRGLDAPRVLYEVNGLVSGGVKGLF